MNKELLKELLKIDNLDELKEKVKENGLNIKDEEIEKAYEQFHSPEHLIDEELFNVTGGCGGPTKTYAWWEPPCGKDLENCGYCEYFVIFKDSYYNEGLCIE